MSVKIKFEELDWQAVLPRVGVDPVLIENPRRLGPCPIEGQGKSRFRFDNKGGRGTWICNHCGAGDGVRLVALVNGTDDAGAIQLIRNAIGGTAHQAEYKRQAVAAPEEKTPQEIEAARRSLKRAWEKAKPIAGTIAETYLKNRISGLQVDWLAQSFRYNPSLYHFDEGTARKSHFPCLLSRVVDAASPSMVVTLHRTYLSTNGGKAAVSPDQVKKLMPATVEKVSGEAIKLNTAVSDVVIVTEGIENGLAWVMACKNRYEVYSTINCNNMAKFKWPKKTRFVLIAGDHDAVNPKTGLRPGAHNAFLLKGRALDAGIKAVVKIPAVQDMDWDDLWNSGNLVAFKIKKCMKEDATTTV